MQGLLEIKDTHLATDGVAADVRPLSYHKLKLACFPSASLEVHLPTVGRRDLGGSYVF